MKKVILAALAATFMSSAAHAGQSYEYFHTQDEARAAGAHEARIFDRDYEEITDWTGGWYTDSDGNRARDFRVWYKVDQPIGYDDVYTTHGATHTRVIIADSDDSSLRGHFTRNMSTGEITNANYYHDTSTAIDRATGGIQQDLQSAGSSLAHIVWLSTGTGPFSRN